MDFWKYLADGKGLFLPEELDLPVDNSMRSRNKATGHEFGGTSNYPYESNAEAPGNTELGFHDPIAGIRKSYSVDRSGEALSDSYTEVAYTSSKLVSREKQSGQRMSGFLMESHSLEFETAVDLKLGRLADTQGAHSIEFSDERQDMCSTSSVPSLPAKRTRMTSLSSQNPYCQVEGCNKDLSSYKDYYKRHKVCDAHTKTAIVVVNGIEQRFCQQCSRFHLLAEFDDGKRSCRKRLANHNERRRKPQGAKFGSSSLGASFVCQGMLPPTSFSFPGEHESGRWIDGHGKFKESTASNPTRFLDFRCSGKGSDDISLAMIGDEMVSFDVPGGSVQNLSSAQDSSTCALSLLSSQSHRNSNTDLLGAPMGRSNQNHQNSIQCLTPSQRSLDRFGAEIENPGDGSVMGPNNVMKMKHNEGGVVDLFQLSSHLQRVENKRNLLH